MSSKLWERPLRLAITRSKCRGDTLENGQSEFLQLNWQVAGLAILLYVGSPQSREGDERKEAKLDAILEAVDKEGKKKVSALDRKFHRT